MDAFSDGWLRCWFYRTKYLPVKLPIYLSTYLGMQYLFVSVRVSTFIRLCGACVRVPVWVDGLLAGKSGDEGITRTRTGKEEGHLR